MAHFSVFFYLHFFCRHFFSWLVCDAYKKWLSRWKIKSVYIKKILFINSRVSFVDGIEEIGWRVDGEWKITFKTRTIWCEMRGQNLKLTVGISHLYYMHILGWNFKIDRKTERIPELKLTLQPDHYLVTIVGDALHVKKIPNLTCKTTSHLKLWMHKICTK